METSGLLKAIAVAASLALAACGGGGGSPKFNTGGDSGGTGSTGGTGGTGGTVTVQVLKLGNGTGSGFTSGALATTKSVLQSGSSATISLNVVDENNAAVSEAYSVSVNSNCVGTGLAKISKNGGDVSQVTTSNGLATFSYTPQGCVGTDTINATLVTETQSLSAEVTITVEQDQVLAVEFVSISKNQLSLRGIGGQETAEVVFKLVGAQSAPIIGEDVTFSLSTTEGGISLAPGTSTGVTDSEGKVTTVVQSGTTATTLKVYAVHDASQIQGSSSDIVISTGVAVDNRFSISYDTQPANAYNTDGIAVSINVIAADQFGNSPPDGTQVRFVSPEAGKVDDACSLIDGRCSVQWLSASPRPADMRVGLLAYMRGAESFTDVNGNAVYDGADTFTEDRAEPYVDANENGMYDLGEFYVDTNQDGDRDLGNNKWDGPCMQGVNAAAICDGESSIFIARQLRIVMSRNDACVVAITGFPAPKPAGGSIDLTVAADAAASGVITLDDCNGNPWPKGTTFKWEVNEADTNILALYGLKAGTISNANLDNGGHDFALQLAGNASPSYTSSKQGTLKLTVSFPNSTNLEFEWRIIYPVEP
ncbi:hypothetical protein [Simiduia agarivorans]|uniref:Carbamoyl-phosphate synthase, large subunit, glutamine-dependent n=1 Tax=Simiduia agarivorans (strain DSM 21679 / JCM 13881 / BCRC 17597 / SA1) TaxID=1117647 RepID=K4KH91_SIMAS|nr:hypothetical protein [Simiduia agarivorans]AFU98376.1 carbamoyl-phosphate synthase, large subunit, glutamine-dependent [Simiduia agarivorans SA1 = DSM 21679]